MVSVISRSPSRSCHARRSSERKVQRAPIPARNALCVSGASTLIETRPVYATSSSSWRATRRRKNACSFGHHQPRKNWTTVGSPPTSSDRRRLRPAWSGSSRSGRSAASAMLRVGEVKAAPRIPLRALVAVRRDAAGVLEHPGDVEQVPGEEGGVAVREVVVGPAGARIEVRRAGPGLTEPAAVGLRWDRVAEVLQRVEDVHRAVLRAVLVAGDDAARDAPVVGVLTGFVEQVAVAVEPLDDLRAHRRLLAEPDG